MKLLLQNKISHLDKFEKLHKLKGDEKIGHGLAKINPTKMTTQTITVNGLTLRLSLTQGVVILLLKSQPWKP